jgi:hypothetical protein
MSKCICIVVFLVAIATAQDDVSTDRIAVTNDLPFSTLENRIPTTGTVNALSVENRRHLHKGVDLSGAYRPSLSDDKDLLVKLEPHGRVSLLNGCNNQASTYKATDDGVIAFA